MTASYIQLPTDQTGKGLATEEVTQSGAPNSNKAHLQKILIADSSGAIVSTLPVSGPLTDAQIRATPLSVEQATAVAVTQDQPTASTAAWTNGAHPDLIVPVANYASASLLIYGTYAGLTLLFLASNNGSNYASIQARNLQTQGMSGAPAPGTNASALYAFDCVGFTHLLINALAGPSSGTANLVVLPSAAPYLAVGAAIVDTELAVAAPLSDTLNRAMVVPHVGAALLVDDGANEVRAPGSVANGLDVDVTRTPRTATATVTNVAASASSVQLLASTAGRLGAIITNDGTSTLYMKLGTTATATTSYSYKVAPGGAVELPDPVYTGRIDGIWTATGGNGALITELS